MQIFSKCYAQYSELYAANHLEAIKCITMMVRLSACVSTLALACAWVHVCVGVYMYACLHDMGERHFRFCGANVARVLLFRLVVDQGLVSRRLERWTDAMEWCRKEVKVREIECAREHIYMHIYIYIYIAARDVGRAALSAARL